MKRQMIRMNPAIQNPEESTLKAKRRRTLGTVTVELAVVLPVLTVLLFGIIEFGLIFRDVMSLKEAAREGVRSASVGAPKSEILDRITDTSPLLNTEELVIEVQYRTYPWTEGEWSTLDDSNEYAITGDQVRVQITYPHRLMTGGLFPQLVDDPDNQTITLTGRGVMRRE